MIVKAFGRARIECDDVFVLLGLTILSDCCPNCQRIDPSRIHGGVDYLSDAHITVHPKKENGDRDYLVGVEIVTCCDHLIVMRQLSKQQWEHLANELEVGVAHARIQNVRVHLPAMSRTSAGRAILRTREKPCMFCSEPTEASDNVCSKCKG